MSGAHPVEVVHVVVPARDEADLLPRLLGSLEAAMCAVRRERPGLLVRATVVLDSCVDDSAVVLAARPWVDVAAVQCGVVGQVRAFGVGRARALAAGVEPARVWIACTDADTVVPESWLVEQVRFADDGVQLLVGTVHPDPADLRPEALAAWRARHRLREGHTHVHGANLGFSLAAYDVAGGFAPVADGEDVHLVAQLRAAGVRWCATARTQVLTSGRRVGRAPAGFSAYLAALDPPDQLTAQA